MDTRVALPCSDFHERIYAGQILRLEGIEALRDLVAFTRSFLEDAFAPHAPPEIHRHLSEEAQADAFAALSRDFSRSGEVKRLWRGIFEAVGLDPTAIARDRLRLRFQPHRPADQPAPQAAGVATVGFHRDTWGTNLYAQTNWWTPIYPITAGRTMALYPALWSRAVLNSSADFDLGEVIERRRTGGHRAVASGQMIPRLLEDIAPEAGIPVVIDPGTVIAFSSAHAHVGIGNATGLTRISLETRTVAIDDVTSGRGAPNVDGSAPWIAPGLFRRVSDGAPLHELLGMRRLEPYRAPSGA
jgi:hypothetical protein